MYMYNENMKIIQQLWNTTHFRTIHVITFLEHVELQIVEQTNELAGTAWLTPVCVCADLQAESHKGNWSENPCWIYEYSRIWPFWLMN
jgi:hypothetical protein